MSNSTLTPYTAVALAEGFEEATEEEILEAWQYLEDTGLGYQLQGHFGRTLRDLIAAGHVTPKNN